MASARSSPSVPATARKNPKGGLTAAGRKHFKETEGSNLRPGVTGKADTPEKMKRKGSFLRRHYGKRDTSPLTDEHGEPTRYAKQAHAWGEPVPKTKADVKRLADKGKALLDRYHKATEARATDKRPTDKSRATDKRPTDKRPTRKRPTNKRAKSRSSPSAAVRKRGT